VHLWSRFFAALFLAVIFWSYSYAHVAVAADSAAPDDQCCAKSLLAQDDDADTQTRLSNGEVVTELVEDGETKFVVSKILIDQPPAAVWPVLVNPFEFAGKICPRMHQCDVLQDQPELSVLQCSIYVCFLFPTITYTVESKYEPVNVVEFKRVSGFLHDFRGSWVLRPRKDGTCTEVLYSMFVDPGVPVPKWIVREAVKTELPRTLIGLRERVDDIANNHGNLEAKTIAAARAPVLKHESDTRKTVQASACSPAAKLCR
jgi:hypothetical protein